MKPEDQKQIALIEHCAKRMREKTEQACKYCYDKFGVENSPDGLLEDIAEMALSIQIQAKNLCAHRDAQPAVAVNEQMLEALKKLFDAVLRDWDDTPPQWKRRSEAMGEAEAAIAAAEQMKGGMR